jgi:hypothetical protein
LRHLNYTRIERKREKERERGGRGEGGVGREGHENLKRPRAERVD